MYADAVTTVCSQHRYPFDDSADVTCRLCRSQASFQHTKYSEVNKTHTLSALPSFLQVIFHYSFNSTVIHIGVTDFFKNPWLKVDAL